MLAPSYRWRRSATIIAVPSAARCSSDECAAVAVDLAPGFGQPRREDVAPASASLWRPRPGGKRLRAALRGCSGLQRVR
jgi:hypothetical protein